MNSATKNAKGDVPGTVEGLCDEHADAWPFLWLMVSSGFRVEGFRV